MKKAVILLSGGLDSTTILYYAKSKGLKPFCLIFDYGQRHRKEIKVAAQIARHAHADYRVVALRFPWKGSSLLDKTKKLPKRDKIDPHEIPSTYVPARNIVFLSLAASYAEAIGAPSIFIGANALDYSGYPDCRPKFFKAFGQVLRRGLKAGVEGRGIRIHTPLLYKTKAQIIKLGMKLKVPYQFTWSCYQGGVKPCGKCDSCLLRERGFEALKLKDPSL